MKKVLLFAFALIFVSIKSQAQSAQESVTVKINSIFDLKLSSGAQTFDFNNVTKYDDGIELDNANTIFYKSNNPWRIMVASTANDYSGTAGSTTPMPASVLQIRKNGSGAAYISNLSTTAQPLPGATGTKGTGNFAVDYKLNPGYGYDPGDYTIVVQYTITNP